MNGSVMPVTGNREIFTRIFIKAWAVIHIVIPAANIIANLFGAWLAI